MSALLLQGMLLHFKAEGKQHQDSTSNVISRNLPSLFPLSYPAAHSAATSVLSSEGSRDKCFSHD